MTEQSDLRRKLKDVQRTQATIASVHRPDRSPLGELLVLFGACTVASIVGYPLVWGGILLLLFLAGRKMGKHQ